MPSGYIPCPLASGMLCTVSESLIPEGLPSGTRPLLKIEAVGSIVAGADANMHGIDQSHFLAIQFEIEYITVFPDALCT